MKWPYYAPGVDDSPSKNRTDQSANSFPEFLHTTSSFLIIVYMVLCTPPQALRNNVVRDIQIYRIPYHLSRGFVPLRILLKIEQVHMVLSMQ
jgi:hypothetical protein